MDKDPNDGQRHNQNQLKEVLQLAIGNTPANDPSRHARTSGPSALDPERRDFLESVLHGISAASAIEEMERYLKEVREGLQDITNEIATEETYSLIEEALEKLIEKTGSIDLANDFHKIGGFGLLIPLLNTDHEGVQSTTLELVAELVQNNPYCQKHALPLLPLLINLIDGHKATGIKVKALYALSCLLRQNTEAQLMFESSDGFSMLLRAIQCDVEKVRTKISFLLSSLCNERPQFRGVLCSMGFVEQLVALLHGDHDLSHEHILSTLLALVLQHEQARVECQRTELEFQNLLKRRISLLEGKEEFIEAKDYCQQLQNLCFGSHDNGIADR